MALNSIRSSKLKDLGDFQTPPALVAEIVDLLEGLGPHPERVLEPTCGIGRFIAEFLDRPVPPREIRGFELQPEHAAIARTIVDPTDRTSVVVECADLFTVDLQSDLKWSGSGPLLVIGNLPWVTTAALGASGGSNGPTRTNHRKRRGIDALTGESNFDISESIWHKLIRELADERPTIALLCKTAVARLILQSIHSADLPITRATLWKIDARRWFRAAVDACLFRVEIGPGSKATEAEVYSELSAQVPESTLGLGSDRLIADRATYQKVAFADGVCPLQWRQGVKHDASAIMELTRDSQGVLSNRLGEFIDVEPEFVFPLLKGTDLAEDRSGRPNYHVIVTQSRLGDETRTLEAAAPRLWSYLNLHGDILQSRKSSIYRGRPRFAMFGIGDYSFAPFKVAISGLHKSPRFRLVGSVDGRPTMLDDTCYFLPCRTLDQARLLEETLNGTEVLSLLRSFLFSDSKRPVTKALLQRIDLKAILARRGLLDHWNCHWETEWNRKSFPTSAV